MMKLYTPFIGGKAGTGLLIFRLITGLALMMHGYEKILHPFTWMDKMGSGVPSFFQFCAALSEFGGGLALVAGLLTPLACVGIAITMAVAIFMVHVPQGGHWIGGPNSFEAAASYLASAILLFFTGPGTISADKFLFGRSAIVESPYVTPSQKLGTGV